MQHHDYPHRVVIRNAEARHAIDLAALMILDERQPLEAQLINLSRHGFRLILPGRFPAGATFRLKVDGWPRLIGQVVWSDGGRTGCLFVEPPSEAVFELMSATTLGIERDDF
jgi:PilZ domain